MYVQKAEKFIYSLYILDIRDFYIVDSDQVLGRGCTGTVRLCTRITTGVQYALKTLRVDKMTPESKQKFHQEISIMTKLDHPNILRLHEYFETDSKVYLVLDLCRGGELLDYLNSQYRHHFDESVVRTYVKQIVGAVVYLHEHGIIHRDLKLENFLLETKEPGSEIKLIDFGLSTYADKHGLAFDPVGTPFYVAPEVLSGTYNNKCDVWSIGVITYMMLCGRPPFFGTSDQLILQAVESHPVDYSHRRFAHVSTAAIDFVATCLDRNVKARPESSALLAHPFFKKSRTPVSSSPVPKPTFNVLQKLNYFLRRPLFYKLCLEAVAFSLSSEQISALRDQFHAFDPDNTGYISIQDLHQMMAGLNLFYRIPDSSFLPGGDEQEDEHRQISYHEFIAATASLQTITEENIKVAFDLLADHNDYIELEAIDTYLGADARGRNASEILSAVGLPAEGKLGYAEVLKFLVSHYVCIALFNVLLILEFKAFLISEYQRAMRYDGILPNGGMRLTVSVINIWCDLNDIFVFYV